MGHVESTIVGKVALALDADGAHSLTIPAPIVTADRPTADGRYLVEASEVAPWAVRPSVQLVGGPLRFVIETQPAVSVTASAGAPVGYGPSSPERRRFLTEPPTRGVDGLVSYPESLDGRYFLAAPSHQHLAALRGDERFVLEAGGLRVVGALPGVSIVVTVEVDGSPRVVTLSPDLLIVDVARSVLSIVSRAVLAGPASLLSHALIATSALRSPDRGDPPPRSVAVADAQPDPWPFHARAHDASFDDTHAANQTVVMGGADLGALRRRLSEETADLASTDLAKLGAASTPFVDPAVQGVRGLTGPVPATPFDRGFVQAQVIPADGVTSTLTPDEEMRQKMEIMRRQLRAQPPADAPPPASDKPKSRG